MNNTPPPIIAPRKEFINLNNHIPPKIEFTKLEKIPKTIKKVGNITGIIL
jgi:hypothetical protein